MSSLNGFEYTDPVTGQTIPMPPQTDETDQDNDESKDSTEPINTNPVNESVDTSTNNNQQDEITEDSDNMDPVLEMETSETNATDETNNTENNLINNDELASIFQSMMGIAPPPTGSLHTGINNQQALAFLSMMLGGVGYPGGDVFDLGVPEGEALEDDEYEENNIIEDVNNNNIINEENAEAGNGVNIENAENAEENSNSSNESDSESDDEEPVNPLLQQLIGGGGMPGGNFQMVLNGPNGQQVTIPMGGLMPGGGGLMSLLGQTRTNYYQHANEQFTWLIGDNEEAKKLYNNCCSIMLGYDRDFVGKFTDDFLRKAHEILEEFYPHIISRLQDVEAEFFDTIYVPVIRGLYIEYRQKCDEKAREALEKCINEFKEGDEFPNCCICLCEIDEGKYTKLPCGHVMHYDCVRTWFSEQLTCPECRYSLEKGKVIKDKKAKKEAQDQNDKSSDLSDEKETLEQDDKSNDMSDKKEDISSGDSSK